MVPVAVTQQLARLSADQLEACRVSVGALDAVCSFRTLPRDDHLDLSWYPAALNDAAADEDALPDLRDALRLAANGRTEVNPAYREAPGSVWEHPVTALAPAQVAEVSSALSRLADSGFPRAEHGRDGLGPAFTSLLEFYAEAARRQLGVIMWWD